MIKEMLFGALFLVFTASFGNTPSFVEEYHNVSTKAEELAYIRKYKKSKEVSVKAYVISLEMKQAEYKTMPWSKLKIFNTKKKELEALILKNPDNIHLRYVRLVIQENTPSILGYTTSKKEDKEFLKKALQKKDSTNYLHTYIINNTSL
ncbi:hypothetical protein P8625_09155 [Tenacibaculum tangerinum]|uniref:SPOR domain-containing protein n=1 Tax=Tenacibaculum tangerinum TaxID=3038772 RepID=A0ABY8KZ29_9FLAO|nr:hypothetical protein [Tenacibaculum tangerinum]WGH74284.1 hypothetical protein P8625_09155 [Tenacibaculum tangerinum]